MHRKLANLMCMEVRDGEGRTEKGNLLGWGD
jgi:hypothetical protein